uniref:Uncharacterized protein n=1 Tax=viral metagenome TaxID=1070528 RepID=A0A6M3LJP6_9ZZZZ
MTIKLFIVLAKNPDDAAEAIQEFLELNYKAWNDLVEERKPTHLSVEPCAHCGVKEGEFHKKGCIFLKGGTDDSTI